MDLCTQIHNLANEVYPTEMFVLYLICEISIRQTPTIKKKKMIKKKKFESF